MDSSEKLYKVLADLNISYEVHQHPPVYTVDEAKRHWSGIRGAHVKNLFLRNKKGNKHYLVVMKHTKKLDMKRIGNQLDNEQLGFASEGRLQKYLGLSTGAVSPFGLINDLNREVEVIVDSDLKKAKLVNFHPNVNTATVTVTFADFQRFLEWTGSKVSFIRV